MDNVTLSPYSYLLLSCTLISIYTFIAPFLEPRFSSAYFKRFVMPALDTRPILLETLLLLICLAKLICIFLNDDFNYAIVYTNSSTNMPTIYKIGALWSNYHGSLFIILLQVTITKLIHNISYQNNISTQNNRTSFCLHAMIRSGFYCFILTNANPFVLINANHTEGLGMNPLLQDIAVTIHPPILYQGYAIWILIFTQTFSYIIQNKIYSIHTLLKASRIMCTTLVGGVSLGSWWAYRELGWGGFWFFDPVENLALIPLILSIAFHHSLILTINQQKSLLWTLALPILGFFSVMLSLFLVRSGALISLHTFGTNMSNSTLLICATICILFISIYSIYKLLRISTLLEDIYKPTAWLNIKSFFSKEVGILIGNFSWLFLVGILLFGIFYPIFLLITKNEIAVMEIEYFKTYFIPIAIPILLSIGMFSYTKTNKPNIIIILSTCTSAILGVFLALILNMQSIILTIILVSSVIVIVNTITFVLKKTLFFTQPSSIQTISVTIGHLGFALLCLSMVLNAQLSKEIKFSGEIGDVVIDDDIKCELKNIRYASTENYLKQVAEVWITKDDGTSVILNPELRLYTLENVMTSDADIFSFAFYDIYAVIKNATHKVEMSIYIRPYISWIWISCIMIMLSMMLSIVTRGRPISY